MQPILTIALRAAQSAADKLNYTVTNIQQLTAEGASRKDIFDKAIEDAAWRARKVIRSAHTAHHIESVQIGMEESREWDRQSRWLIDVAAGEANLRQCYPHFLVHVALYTKDKIDCVAVVNPMTEEWLTASKGRGVQFGERRVRADYAPLKNALCALSTRNAETLTHWFNTAAGIRMTGCALQNFIDLAAGRVHIAVSDQMDPAGIAAAMLIAQESGALTGDINGKPVKMDKGELLAATPKLFKQLLAR
ncbi:MAG: inositol monophosphatase family protein [Reinekea sp.]|jgi:myo-inositol-1(or 4)-monophosphatase